MSSYQIKGGGRGGEGKMVSVAVGRAQKRKCCLFVRDKLIFLL